MTLAEKLINALRAYRAADDRGEGGTQGAAYGRLRDVVDEIKAANEKPAKGGRR